MLAIRVHMRLSVCVCVFYALLLWFRYYVVCKPLNKVARLHCDVECASTRTRSNKYKVLRIHTQRVALITRLLCIIYVFAQVIRSARRRINDFCSGVVSRLAVCLCVCLCGNLEHSAALEKHLTYKHTRLLAFI